MEWICAFHLLFFASDLQHVLLNRGIATFWHVFSICSHVFSHFFANLPFPSMTSGKAGKIQKTPGNLQKNNAKNMQNKCNKNCKKDAKQAKKTLKLETKTLFIAVSAFVPDISLFFLRLFV